MDYSILKQYVFDNDITIEELSVELECSRASLSRIINNKHVPRPALRKKIKELLEDYKPYKDSQKNAKKNKAEPVNDKSKGPVDFIKGL